MNPLRRRTRSVTLRNHEDRVQALERRIPVDYPLWVSYLMDQVVVEVADEYFFGWSFPDDEPCELPDCEEDEAHTVGDYLLLPQGYDGAFEVYLTAFVASGSSNFSEYYTTTVGGDQSIHGKSSIAFLTEIWRDNAPFGNSTYRAYEAWGEVPPPTGVNLVDRMFSHHAVVPALSSLDITRDRWAIAPYFDVAVTLAGPATVKGLVCAVKMFPPIQKLSGYSV